MKTRQLDFQDLKNEAAPNWEELQVDRDLFGSIQDQLREQILDATPISYSQNELSCCSANVVELALTNQTSNTSELNQSLGKLFDLQYQVYLNTNISKALRKRQYINACGLVMSPDHCVTTVKDTLRLRSFFCGIDQAIKDLRQSTQEPLHIVYPACGPFAPLLLPLLSYYQENAIYSPEDITITFIDLQKGAILALDALIKAQNLEAFVNELICDDAMTYQPDKTIDIVVLEAMQHGFTREGHFALSQHFSQFLDNKGVLIPQRISVQAMLAVAQKEYVEQWQSASSLMSLEAFQNYDANHKLRESFLAERTELGEILCLDVNFLRKAKVRSLNQHTSMVECNTVLIPELAKNHDKQTLLIYCQVNTYGDFWLNEYESGITQPLPDLSVCINFVPQESRSGDLLVTSGEFITFYYCLNGLPGFLPIKKNTTK